MRPGPRPSLAGRREPIGPLTMTGIRFSKRLKIITALVMAIGFAANGCFGVGATLLRRVENKAIDYRFLIRGSRPVGHHTPIAIVLIDNPSALAYGYRSPTPRRLLAQLIESLDAKGARVIGIDVFLDRSYNADEDRELEAALSAAGRKVVLVCQLEPGDGGRGGVLERFARHAHLGFSVSRSEGDEAHRWVHMGRQGDRAAFSRKMYELYTGRPARLPDRAATATPRRGDWTLLSFPGPPSRLEGDAPNFLLFSAADVPYLPETIVRDRIFLIGSGIEDLGDIFLTPFSTQDNGYLPMFGVELQAIALSMFFSDDFILAPTDAAVFGLYLVLFSAAAVAFLFLRPLWALPLLPAAMVGWAGLSVYGFTAHRLLLPVAYPVAVLLIIYILCQGLIRWVELRQSRFMKRTFSHYISPELVDRLADRPEAASLGGEKRELTVFFSDLQGFTSISENLQADKLMGFLHWYFEEMTAILFEERGTLDKYIGDAVMAFFGAPNPLPAHAAHACRAALRMQDRLSALNHASSGTEGWLPVTVRIGINTDTVFVGNSGSKTRFNYTVMGDGVNLAARLEGANKLFGSRILVSEATLAGIASAPLTGDDAAAFFTRELGRFVVKGKKKPVPVHELVGFEDTVTETQRRLKEAYEAALSDFYAGSFDAARRAFSRIHQTFDDGASAFMLQQLDHVDACGVDDAWNGQVILMTK